MTLLKHKSDSFPALQKFITLAYAQFGKRVKIVTSDNALEFQDSNCKILYDVHGIIHQTTCVFRAQQNDRCERKHRNVLEMARCLRLQVGLAKYFWGDCVLTSAYLINRLPTSSHHHKTPYEVLHHKQPTYNHLKPFGCLALAYNPALNNDKLNPRVPCLFLGYLVTQKGYKLLNLLTKHTFVSRDIKWLEHVFPHTFTSAQLQQLIPQSSNYPLPTTTVWEDFSNDESNTDPPSTDPAVTSPTLPSPADSPPTSPEHPNQPTLRRSHRQKTTPAWLQDYITPIANFTSTSVQPQFHCFMVQLHQTTDPTTFLEAIKYPHWVQAMNEELSALEDNLTWLITDLPHWETSHWEQMAIQDQIPA